ncbi:hypothetical protein M404DRAFT_35829 [Pisolithus tinctorius Marx 270]|uniref:Uncharacterized protein n=1 Tax=Pisolithus tinctorius Marx 270 TaxID=870435 RepID=A0A0C3I9A9_PISTI|nr:hypothetical protein M404DRAFT_35829 [Pisolithus tinctorius Marx 270]
MSSQAKSKKAKTRPKYPASSGLNPAGNPAASQLNITDEQPLTASAIDQQLQSQANFLQYQYPDDHDQGLLTTTDTGHEHPHPPISNPANASYGAALPLPFDPANASCSTVPLVPFNLTNASYGTAPLVPFNPANTSYSTAPPIPMDLGHLMGSMAYPYSPPNFDYAPSALVTRQLNHLSSRVFPYSPQTQHIRNIERPLRGGEEVSNQRFVQVGQTMRSIARGSTSASLPTVHPTPDASSSATIDPGLQAANISTAVRFNLKRRLFITNLLPKKSELSAIITQALQETALGHTGGKPANIAVDNLTAAAGDWLRTNIMSETNKLKEVVTNIRSDFRSAACILALPLYGLTVPVQRCGEEVQLHKDRIPYLLKDFAWLDEPKTVQILSPFDVCTQSS